MYSPWTRLHASTDSSWIVSDASAHRIVSNLSALIGRQYGHRIVVAGDLNILHGYGDRGSAYWAKRYETVFTRMKALRLPFVGPQAPNGRQADPWPDELPRHSENVPTYHTNRQTPRTATRQLNFVFASEGFADSLTVRALNRPEQWGAERPLLPGNRDRTEELYALTPASYSAEPAARIAPVEAQSS